MPEETAEPTISELRAQLNTPPPEAAQEPEAPAAKAKTEPAPEPEKTRGADGKFVAKDATDADDDAAAVTPNVQKRIDKAVRAQREAERERDELKAAAAGKPGSQPAKETAPPAAAANKPDPNDPKWKDYGEYIEALADWKADTREAARAAAERARANATAWKERESEAKTEHADYDEVLAGAAKLPISRAMHEAIVESPEGAEMAYYLAKNPDEAARIAALGPNAGAREMGKLEAQLAKAPGAGHKEDAAAATPKPKPAAKPLPKPAASVGGSHAPAAVDLDDPALDMRAFRREVEKRLAV